MEARDKKNSATPKALLCLETKDISKMQEKILPGKLFLSTAKFLETIDEKEGNSLFISSHFFSGFYL